MQLKLKLTLRQVTARTQAEVMGRTVNWAAFKQVMDRAY
jgi:hypothetical protein